MNRHIKETLSAGGVVINQDSSVLVVNQKRDSWSLPKGHIESGETELEAAMREISEESGITQLELIKSFKPYSRYKIGKGGIGDDKSEIKKIIMFLFRTSQVDLKPVDPENPEAQWVNKDKVAELLTHVKDKEFFLSIINEI